jgi:hypothetical protein
MIFFAMTGVTRVKSGRLAAQRGFPGKLPNSCGESKAMTLRGQITAVLCTAYCRRLTQGGKNLELPARGNR